jgi:hypothetical protein
MKSESSVTGARGADTANKSYRCYFTEGDDRIRSYEQMACENDAGCLAVHLSRSLAGQAARGEMGPYRWREPDAPDEWCRRHLAGGADLGLRLVELRLG